MHIESYGAYFYLFIILRICNVLFSPKIACTPFKSGSQINNKSSKHDSMTAEFCKNFYQKTNLNDFRLGILGNKKVLKKFQIGWREMLVASLPSRNNFLVIAVKNYRLQMKDCRCLLLLGRTSNYGCHL